LRENGKNLYKIAGCREYKTSTPRPSKAVETHTKGGACAKTEKNLTKLPDVESTKHRHLGQAAKEQGSRNTYQDRRILYVPLGYTLLGQKTTRRLCPTRVVFLILGRPKSLFNLLGHKKASACGKCTYVEAFLFQLSWLTIIQGRLSPEILFEFPPSQVQKH